MRVVAGLAPLPYHAVSVCVHAASSALLALLLSRRLAPAAALMGAAFFAAHPALFTAIYSISGIGELLAVGFALAALFVLALEGRARWGAVPLFAASLLSKENTALLPLAFPVALPFLRAPSGRRGRDLPLIVVTAVSLAWIGYLIATDSFGVRGASNVAYAVDPGASVVRNLLTYLGWTVNPWLPTVSSFSDAVEPDAYPWAFGAMILWLAGLAVPALRARGWIAGGLLFLFPLVPVLPLANHTYHYYLTAPLAGAAWCVAALADGALAPLRRTAVAWAACAAVAALFAVNGAAMIRKIETMPFIYPQMRSNATVDRARIVANVRESLAGSQMPPGARVVFWSPISIGLGPVRTDAQGDTIETYWESNVRAALMDGLGVRLLAPQVGGVEFVRSFESADPDAFWAVYRPDGRLKIARAGELDSVLRAAPIP
jgi:hypothetical protein